MKTKYVIIGAGIGGLAAGAELKRLGETDFVILEKQDKVPMNFHNGLHYLHSTDFNLPFEFTFKKNPITEEIWNTKTNTFSKCATLPEAIEYSKKIMESKRHVTSIMDPGKLKEVIVPENDDMNSLIQAYVEYIGLEHFQFGEEVQKIKQFPKEIFTKQNNIYEYEFIITTAPLTSTYEVCGTTCPYELKNQPLYITNFENRNIVKNWLIVLYMSDPKFPPHRITAMNGILSMESMRELTQEDDIIIKYLIGDLFDYCLESRTSYKWDTGRIFGLDTKQREEIVSSFAAMDIYLLGRFARWEHRLRIDTTILQAQEIIQQIYAISRTIPAGAIS